MHNTVKNLLDIENNIKINLDELNIYNYPKIIAVSKTFKIDKILPLIEHGHIDFGENKVQEAIEKWSDLREKKTNIQLHMIGKLQTNKVRSAVKLFDYIHSVDSQKLADVLAKHQKSIDRNLNYFIQVNLGNEIQKSGIPVSELDAFHNYCKNEINLNVIGLMVIPPINQSAEKYFKSLNELNKTLSLENLSMGMSADYMEAIKHGSNFVRVGSSIFGSRS